MHIKHHKNLLTSQELSKKVVAIAWAPSRQKFAIAKADLTIYLYDNFGEKRDKFKTKPCTSSSKDPYTIKDLAFSPDSTKLAIAQSDNIIFIYKIGLDWEKKKTICNKFMLTHPPQCIYWSSRSTEDIYIGTKDGRIQKGNLSSNKSTSIGQQHPSKLSVIQLKGDVCVFLDGTIWKLGIEEEGGMIGQHQAYQIRRGELVMTSIPSVVAISKCNIMIASIDRKVIY